ADARDLAAARGNRLDLLRRDGPHFEHVVDEQADRLAALLDDHELRARGRRGRRRLIACDLETPGEVVDRHEPAAQADHAEHPRQLAGDGARLRIADDLAHLFDRHAVLLRAERADDELARSGGRRGGRRRRHSAVGGGSVAGAGRSGHLRAPQATSAASGSLAAGAAAPRSPSTSVTRSANSSSMTTTSPRAIGVPFTSRSTGSPATRSSTTIEPGRSSSVAPTVMRVRPISTASSTGTSDNRPRSAGPAPAEPAPAKSVPARPRSKAGSSMSLLISQPPIGRRRRGAGSRSLSRPCARGSLSGSPP